MVSKYKLFAVVAVVASYLVGKGVLSPPWYLTLGYIGTFIEGFLLQFTVWAFYSVLLKHRLSPMRHLPGPKVREALIETPLYSEDGSKICAGRITVSSWDNLTPFLQNN